MYEEGASFCAGPAAVAGAGKRGEGLLSSSLDAVTLGEQKKASLCRACSAAVLWEGGERTALPALAGWRAALLWHRRCSVYPQTSLTTVAEY